MAERPLRIPDPDRTTVAAFLKDHPEQTERMRQLFAWDREVRDFAEALVADIDSHFHIGSPSRWGLGLSLSTFQLLLDEQEKRSRLTQRGSDLETELALVQEMLAAKPVVDGQSPRTHYLVSVIDELRGQVVDAGIALMETDRATRYEIARARADALREAAALVRRGEPVEELDRRAAEAAPGWPTLEEILVEPDHDDRASE